MRRAHGVISGSHRLIARAGELLRLRCFFISAWKPVSTDGEALFAGRSPASGRGELEGVVKLEATVPAARDRRLAPSASRWCLR